MSHTISTRPRLSLTVEQEEIIRQVLERNHAYYVAQGMSRSHMWPEEILSEIHNELAAVAHGAPLPGTPEDKLDDQKAEMVADLAVTLGRIYNSKR